MRREDYIKKRDEIRRQIKDLELKNVTTGMEYTIRENDIINLRKKLTQLQVNTIIDS